MPVISRDTTFLGYRRENGRVGVRNFVIVLPLDDLSNAAAEAVAHNIKGALAIPHPYGRLQFGADLELHFRTLIGTGSNPARATISSNERLSSGRVRLGEGGGSVTWAHSFAMSLSFG